MLRTIILWLSFGTAMIWAQCGQLVVNPTTGLLDCTGVSGAGNVSVTLPSTANVLPQFADTNGNLSSSNLAQDPTHGSITPLAAVFMFPIAVSENAGAPVFDCSVANYFTLTVTQADTISLANCSPVNGARPHFGYRITQDGTGGHAVTLPAGFSQASAVDTTANIATTQWGTWDGSNFSPDSGAFSSQTGLWITGPTRAAPATCASGICVWGDSTGLNLEAKTSAGISGTAFTLANSANKWLNSFDATTGLFTQTQPASSNLSDFSTLRKHHMVFAFDGGGSAVTINKLTTVSEITFPCTVSGWNLFVDTGTATVDVLKATNSNGTPSFATITAAQTPTISSGTNNRSTTVNNWTSPTTNDLLQGKVTAVTGATQIGLVVECNQ